MQYVITGLPQNWKSAKSEKRRFRKIFWKIKILDFKNLICGHHACAVLKHNYLNDSKQTTTLVIYIAMLNVLSTKYLKSRQKISKCY